MATTMTASNQQYYATNYQMPAQTIAGSHHELNQNYHHHHAQQQQQQHQQHYNYHQPSLHQLDQQHHHHQQQHPQQQQQLQTYHQQHQHHQMSAAPNLIQLGQNQVATRTVSATSLHSNNNSPASTGTATNLYGIEATKSTKGASKQRRDLISQEIVYLRELLPIPELPQKVSQLQLMALVLVYVRKSNYFKYVFGDQRDPSLSIPVGGFTKALNGFIMILTQKGKLLYISDNAAEHLGHSMEDILSHGDEVYDIIEDQDKKTVRTELLSNDDACNNNGSLDNSSSASSLSASSSPISSLKMAAHHQYQHSAADPSTETRIALCRMNVSKNRQSRRQMRFGDQKIVLVEGHYSKIKLQLSSREEPVFFATCTPVAMPETRECVVQGSTNVFTSIHSMDMKFLYIDAIGEHHLDCNKQQIHNTSWYDLVHFDYLREAQLKHKRLTSNYCSSLSASSEQPQLHERSTIVLLKMFSFSQNRTIWMHSVMKVKEATDSSSQPVIVCTNQVLSEREAQVLRSNSWLYDFYSLHPKLHHQAAVASLNGGSQTPQSICSSDEQLDQAASDQAKSTISGITAGGRAKSPPAVGNSISAAATGAANLQKGAANSFELVQFSGNQDNSATYYSSNFDVKPTPVQLAGSSLKCASKLSPLNHSPTSTISSSPLSSSSAYQQPAAPRYEASHGQHFAGSYSQQHGAGSLGSSSASSTSSTSSSSSSQNNTDLLLTTPPANQSQSKAAAAVASLYAGIDAITAATAVDQTAAAYQNQSSAVSGGGGKSNLAVNYANHVMAAQRVAAHHHHPYHPYHHHQHHPMVHHHQQAAAGHHLAPHHHSHHTTGSHHHHHPASFYPANHHHVSAAAAANAYHHHHAAYHSTAAAAVAAVTNVAAAHHPAHHNYVNYLNVN